MLSFVTNSKLSVGVISISQPSGSKGGGIRQGFCAEKLMNISLTRELEEFIDKKVKSGLYHSASEVIRESLRLLKEQDELNRIRREELRREIMLGMEQIKHGKAKVYPSGKALAEEVKKRGRKVLTERTKKKK